VNGLQFKATTRIRVCLQKRRVRIEQRTGWSRAPSKPLANNCSASVKPCLFKQ